MDLADAYLTWCFAHRTPPHVNELAARLGLSADRFSRLFSSAVGEHPSDYLKRRQIERAKKLLLETNLEIVEVSGASGYGTEMTLYRNFRRATGTTPLRFRQGG